MAKNKIQVTTAEVHAPAQVILPNTYFVSKAVRATIAIDNLRDYFKMMEKDHRQDIDPFIKDQLEAANGFLHELMNALEGEEEGHE